jgi:selenocysteine-specific elongation factor
MPSPSSATSEASPSVLRPLLIGTAGHIDHGKTSLVARLTGVNTDRLPEEKARGISIDLGFAHFDCEGFRFGVVDVPGHERFVRQMVAGAANVDVVLFVVAADDGVMPQTREHLDILQLLGMKAGVVALTRLDLVDAEMLELVTAEVQELVASTFLASAPIVPVSSVTGEGFPELVAALCQIARQVPDRAASPLFRLPVDRVFTLAGRGTIVTGSILTGRVSAGDEVELLPQQIKVRVRSVQHHGTSVADADAHRRAALNLPGVGVDDIHRGDELASPGLLRPTRRLLAELECLRSADRPLRHRQLLTIHAGTATTVTRLRLPDGAIAPGQRAFADLRLRDPLVLTWDQHFILRTSSSLTVGGGRVLDPLPRVRRIRDLAARCESAGSESPRTRLTGLLRHEPTVSGSEVLQRLGCVLSDCEPPSPATKSGGRDELLVDKHSGKLVHRRWLERLSRSVLRVLEAELVRLSPRKFLPRAELLTLCRDFEGAELVPSAIAGLLASGQLMARGDLLGPADRTVALTKRQREVLDLLLPQLQQHARTPPTHKELYAMTDRMGPADIEALLRLCHEDGSLIAVSQELSYVPGGLGELQRDLAALFATKPDVTLAEIRDALKMTRKHVVPLAEYWDKARITIRHGDIRRQGPELQVSELESQISNLKSED